MKYGTIKGEVTAAGHDNWIQCESVGFGVSRPSSVESGAGQGKRHTDAATVGDIQISRSLDSASPYFFNESCGGEETDAIIHFVKTEKKKLETYMEYKLSGCLITSYSSSGGDGGASESLSLNYMEIQMNYTAFDEKGSTKKHKGKFDVGKAEVG